MEPLHQVAALQPAARGQEARGWSPVERTPIAGGEPPPKHDVHGQAWFAPYRNDPYEEKRPTRSHIRDKTGSVRVGVVLPHGQATLASFVRRFALSPKALDAILSAAIPEGPSGLSVWSNCQRAPVENAGPKRVHARAT